MKFLGKKIRTEQLINMAKYNIQITGAAIVLQRKMCHSIRSLMQHCDATDAPAYISCFSRQMERSCEVQNPAKKKSCHYHHLNIFFSENEMQKLEIKSVKMITRGFLGFIVQPY